MCKNLDRLVGKEIKNISGLIKESEEVYIETNSGTCLFYHSQDCCESVWLEDFEGDVLDLIGSTIISVEEVTNEGNYDDPNAPPNINESYTYTFYKLETTKGGLWMRWLGTSNGYYSEAVDITWLNIN